MIRRSMRRENLEDRCGGDYSDDDDVPPSRNGLEVWNYFYISKDDLAKGLDKVKEIYKLIETPNNFILQKFRRVSTSIYFTPSSAVS